MVILIAIGAALFLVIVFGPRAWNAAPHSTQGVHVWPSVPIDWYKAALLEETPHAAVKHGRP